MKRHVNIPVFIPHLGCPNQCVFCNQRAISGVTEFGADCVREIIDEALATVRGGQESEIAFFGGSFTGIDRSLMISLLDIAKEYIDAGKVSSIRLSTRPDYINLEIIEILKKYGVKTVELGLQSTSPDVLMLTKRGHGFEEEEKACRMIVEAGFELVGQMMIGLPGSDLQKELECAEFIVKSGATGARIYPTVVFYETELCEMAKAGLYEPISLEDAVVRCAAVFEKFYEAGVGVIRIGIHSSENLTSRDSCFGGPNHPALGELVINEFFFGRISKELSKYETKDKTVRICVAKGALSKAVGQKQKNKKRLSAEFSAEVIFSESDTLSDYDFLIKIVERKKDVLKKS